MIKQSFLYMFFNVNALRAIFILWIFFIEIKVLRTNPADLMYLHFLQAFTYCHKYCALKLILNYTTNGEVILTSLSI
jgi:hypothetical protein